METFGPFRNDYEVFPRFMANRRKGYNILPEAVDTSNTMISSPLSTPVP